MTFQELLADSNVSVAVLADTDTLIPPGQVRRSDREKSDATRPRSCKKNAKMRKLGSFPSELTAIPADFLLRSTGRLLPLIPSSRRWSQVLLKQKLPVFVRFWGQRRKKNLTSAETGILAFLSCLNQNVIHWKYKVFSLSINLCA